MAFGKAADHVPVPLQDLNLAGFLEGNHHYYQENHYHCHYDTERQTFKIFYLIL